MNLDRCILAISDFIYFPFRLTAAVPGHLSLKDTSTLLGVHENHVDQQLQISNQELKKLKKNTETTDMGLHSLPMSQT